MKSIHLPLLGLAFLLCISCQNDNEKSPTGTAKINFNVTNYEQISLDNVTTRSAEATSLAHLALGVYDSETHKAITDVILQSSGDSNYGSFSVELPIGNYILVFLGYDGSRTAHMDDPKNIYFDDSFVPNLFCKSVTLNVNSSTTQTQSISLARAVAGFSLVCDDETPSNFGMMEFTMQGGSGKLNALTGYSNSTESRTYTFKSLSSYAGKSNMNINLYTFLPQEETEMTFVVKAMDTDGTTLQTRTFENAPMKINQRTRYTGSFFSSESSVQGFTLLLDNNDWVEKDYTY